MSYKCPYCGVKFDLPGIYSLPHVEACGIKTVAALRALVREMATQITGILPIVTPYIQMDLREILNNPLLRKIMEAPE
mgnify:CR=1 FL=1